jgi:two-component system sensor histidine kinase UhpB
MNQELKLLLLEDNPNDALLIQTLLRRSGMQFRAIVASDEEEFLLAMQEDGYDAVLADNALPQYSSMEALKMIRATNPLVAFILVTGTVSEEFAVNIIQQGADDYILKTNLTRLPTALKSAIQKKRIQRDKEQAEQEIENEKELSSSIINSLPGIFYLCDNAGKFIRCNKNFERISGYSFAEISKMTPEYFFGGEEKDHISRFIKKIFATGYSETEAVFTTRDMNRIPYYFTGMAATLKNKDCLICVGLDISASKEAETALKDLNDELRRVSAHMEKIREEEQARIAREVHDQLGQQLTGLKMDISWLRDSMAKNISPEQMREKLSEMSKMVDDAVVSVRKVASDLRPSILDDFGIVEALDWQSKEFKKRSGIEVSFSSPVHGVDLDPAVSISLFRIYQEVLTNVARHAEAKNITAVLDVNDNKVMLQITDDGKGFDAGLQKKTLGLLGMKERAHMINGDLEIVSEPGKGTTVSVTVALGARK